MQNSSSKSERIKALANGEGIDYLLQEAYAILGNPILIHDMEYKAVALNKNAVTDDPIWNAYATKGTVGRKWLDFFKNECFLEAAANAKTITFLTSDKLKYNRIFGKLFNKNNIQIGCAVLLACDKPFADEDPILFEELCAILSAEFGKNDFYNVYGQAYFEKLMKELIAGVEDAALYAAHVESIYLHLKSNLYLAVVDIGKCDPTYTKLTHYRDLLKKTQPEYAYAIYGNSILIIIGTDSPKLYIEKDIHQLHRFFHENNIYAGISESFENLFELGKYYRKALAAMEGGPGFPGQHIFMNA